MSAPAPTMTRCRNCLHYNYGIATAPDRSTSTVRSTDPIKTSPYPHVEAYIPPSPANEWCELAFNKDHTVSSKCHLTPSTKRSNSPHRRSTRRSAGEINSSAGQITKRSTTTSPSPKPRPQPSQRCNSDVMDIDSRTRFITRGFPTSRFPAERTRSQTNTPRGIRSKETLYENVRHSESPRDRHPSPNK